MTNEPQLSDHTEEDLRQQLVIHVLVDEDGDVSWATNQAQLNYFVAIGILETAVQMMVSESVGHTKARKQKAAQNRPNIIVPDIRIAPKR